MTDPPSKRHPGAGLVYQPQDPATRDQRIGVIGCGGISEHHLTAYRSAAYPVVALCDQQIERARQRRDEFFPDADVHHDYRTLLARDDIQVVDVATHPRERVAMLREAIGAGKHILSQKPFVEDLSVGQELVELADRHHVYLAVNQNARWAPHFSFLRAAVKSGLLGELASIHFSVHWDHSWVKGTEFEQIDHLILYDFGIHWFDLVACLMAAKRPRRVYASTTPTAWQEVPPPLQAQTVIEYDGVHVSIVFDGNTRYGAEDRTYVCGSLGSFSSVGAGSRQQNVTLTTEHGSYQPELVGCWFPDGFHGTMGELLRSIEEQRSPEIDARRNLDGLALCFAAMQSADQQAPVVF